MQRASEEILSIMPLDLIYTFFAQIIQILLTPARALSSAYGISLRSALLLFILLVVIVGFVNNSKKNLVLCSKKELFQNLLEAFVGISVISFGIAFLALNFK